MVYFALPNTAALTFFVAGLSSIVAASSRDDGETQTPVTFKRPTHLDCGSALAINLPNVES